MTKKQIITTIIITVIMGSFMLGYYLYTNKQTTKTPKTVNIPNVVYKDISTAKDSFANFGVAISNNSKIYTNKINTTNTQLPETVNVYNYKPLSNNEWQKLTQTLSETTGIPIENGSGALNNKTIYINYDTGLISYTNETQDTTTFSKEFNDQVFLPQAKNAITKMGIDLSTYEYTTYAYQDPEMAELVTVNAPNNASFIKYTFEKKIDGYEVMETINNSTKKISVWLNTKGEMVKFQGAPLGRTISIKATMKTKTLSEIKTNILDGSITGIGGSVNITGEKLLSLNITKAEIIYSITGENLVPLVKLTCNVKTDKGDQGEAYFVTDLIDLNNVKEINE